MCAVSVDFDPTVDLGAMRLASPGSSCASMDNHLKTLMEATSWDNMTCDAMASTVSYTTDGVDVTVAMHLMSLGEACCGSAAQTRCWVPSDRSDCTWDGFLFDCSDLGQKDPWGNFLTFDPWEACREGGWMPECTDLYPENVLIREGCAATCEKYQYVYHPCHALP